MYTCINCGVNSLTVNLKLYVDHLPSRVLTLFTAYRNAEFAINMLTTLHTVNKKPQ